MLGAGEHQHLLPVVVLDQVRQQIALVRLRHPVHRLLDDLHRGVAARHFDALRVVQQAVGERPDLVGEGRREQQVLALLRQHGEHFLDVADEAHVEHAVGFVEHQDFDAGQVHRLLTQVVEQAARRGHQNVDARFQRLELRIDVDAAEHHHRGERQVFAVGLDRFLDLRGEFARRHQDQAARAARLRRLRGARRQMMQDRQGEAGGLAGAGLRGGEQVAAFQHLRNRLRLDRGGRGVAGIGNRTHNGFGQSKTGKGGFSSHVVFPATACRVCSNTNRGRRIGDREIGVKEPRTDWQGAGGRTIPAGP